MPPRVRHGALAAALALLVLAGIRPALAPSDVRGVGVLPACRYDDILTTPRGYDDWSTTLVDTILRLPRSYVPPDLVSVSQAGIAGHGRIRAIVIDDLKAMTEAAAAAGNAIGVESAYRSYDDQVSTFDHWIATSGYAAALTFSARPGHSEHQLGLAIDFRSDPGGSPFTGSWGQTPAGKWMRLHAWEYGFIRSYPPKDQALTCYASEAWHYRYVGRDLAAAIQSSGLTTRAYLWANFTTAVVPRLAPKPTKSPAGTGTPSEPAESAMPSPSAPEASEAPGGEATPVVGTSPAAETRGGTGAAAGGPPGQTAPPVELSPVADLDPGVAAGLIFALGAILGVTVLVLRRGRSGVGL